MGGKNQNKNPLFPGDLNLLPNVFLLKHTKVEKLGIQLYILTKKNFIVHLLFQIDYFTASENNNKRFKMTPTNKSVDIETADSEITTTPGTCPSGWTACWNQRTLPEKLLLSAIAIIFIGTISTRDSYWKLDIWSFQIVISDVWKYGLVSIIDWPFICI